MVNKGKERVTVTGTGNGERETVNEKRKRGLSRHGNIRKCKFNVKHRECLRDHPSQRLKMKCLTIIQIELEFENAGF